MRLLGIISLVLGSFSAALAADVPYRLEVRDARTIHATLTQDIKAPKLRASRWVGVVARPPDLPGQIVRDVKFSPDGQPATEASDAHRPILVADVRVDDEARKSAISFRAEFSATLQSRRLVRVPADQKPPQVGPLSAEIRARSLAATAICDHGSSEIRNWITSKHLDREAGEGDVDLGRRVFSHLQKNFHYEYTATLDRRASNVVRAGRSDCGGLGILFIAAMRANGVPARQRVGRWASSEVPGEKVSDIPYHQEHAKAEFFADGVGWVPVDPASAVLYDKTPEGLNYFGNDDGDFLTLHTDGDLVVDSRLFGRHMFESLQGIVYWVSGGGSLDDLKAEEHWTIRYTTARQEGSNKKIHAKSD